MQVTGLNAVVPGGVDIPWPRLAGWIAVVAFRRHRVGVAEHPVIVAEYARKLRDIRGVTIAVAIGVTGNKGNGERIDPSR